MIQRKRRGETARACEKKIEMWILCEPALEDLEGL